MHSQRLLHTLSKQAIHSSGEQSCICTFAVTSSLFYFLPSHQHGDKQAVRPEVTLGPVESVLNSPGGGAAVICRELSHCGGGPADTVWLRGFGSTLLPLLPLLHRHGSRYGPIPFTFTAKPRVPPPPSTTPAITAKPHVMSKVSHRQGGGDVGATLPALIASRLGVSLLN